ncbi:unnamed protein product [Adineta steineri]|uniref:Uncharacterized protein n=1 Tax=Adineta steineri TaxID=433720 RepID=A0A814SQD7_9BILA|nr:unnamed protein product [Adineta steineri]CAF3509679.1 unnamed protein product [Adineta steineri]
MALTRIKPNVNSELFHQRYSELSDEVRAKNKREDRLLHIRLKYYEREKNTRLNILRKEQYQLERTRSLLTEQCHKIQQDKQKQFISLYFNGKTNLEQTPIVRLSTPEFFNTDWETTTTDNNSIKHTNVIRPHSAG